MATGPFDADSSRSPVARPFRSPAVVVAAVCGSARSFLARARAAASRRASRPHLAYLGIPLAMVATLLTVPIFSPALIVCGWWWAPRDWGWEWLVVAGRGLLGLEWALVGLNLLADFPNSRVINGLAWTTAALVIGGIAHIGGSRTKGV